MAAAKKKKQLTYKGRPIYRIGNTIYCGNLADKYILALDIEDSKKVKDINVTTKVKIKIMDNSGEFGKGQVFRQSEKDNLFKAFDLGLWWLDEAINFG